MIIYFSGTGNSSYIANRLAKGLNQKIISINDKLKCFDNSEINVNEALIIVTPTYAWRIPKIVEKWIEETKFNNVESVYFVMSCGSDISNAKEYNINLCEKKGFNYKGTAQIVMPENYIAMFNAPNNDEANQIIEKANPYIDELIDIIKSKRNVQEQKTTILRKLKSGIINTLFYKTYVNDSKYYVKDSCVGCGLCEELCPLNNIKIVNGKPIWNDNCTQCMACINHCPKESIEYGNMSKGKPRYHCD